jgi:hypothetical protein
MPTSALYMTLLALVTLPVCPLIFLSYHPSVTAVFLANRPKVMSPRHMLESEQVRDLGSCPDLGLAWLGPAYREGTDTLQRGSLGVAKKLTSIQHITAITMTGAMRGMATDVLEAHANLLPMTLLLQDTCHHTITRLAAYPDTHPLYTSVCKAARCYISSHHSSLHHLT